MNIIEHDELAVGQKISYRFGNREGLVGPFIVKGLSRDHEGAYALLKDVYNDGVRTIHIADDEDYGALFIYLHE